MSTIRMGQGYECEKQRAYVEDRGGVGKIYLYTPDNGIEAIFLWGPNRRISESGVYATSLTQRVRAIRAIASSPFRHKAGFGDLTDREVEAFPSADEVEAEEMKRTPLPPPIRGRSPLPPPAPGTRQA